MRPSSLHEEVKKLVGSHHNYKKLDISKSRLAQILTVADIYSALKEKRPYRGIMGNKETFEILKKCAKEGKFNMKYVKFLEKAVKKIF